MLFSRAQALQDQIDELSAPNAWLEKVMTKRLLVHMRNDQTIDGSLVANYDDGIVLRAAKLLGDGTTGGTALAGEVFIPREQVFFCQLDG